MNSAVIAFLTCLLVFYVQGQHVNSYNKCKCSNGYISSRISRQHIKAGPVVHDPSVFCPRTEIIITTTANKEKCVNPQSPLGQLILKNKNKQQKSRAVSTMAASGSTSLHPTVASSSTSPPPTATSSPTSLHPTAASSSTSLHPTATSSPTSLHPMATSNPTSLHPTATSSSASLHPTVASSSTSLQAVGCVKAVETLH